MSEIDNLNLEPINTLWIGSQLSRIEEISINSFLKVGHPVHIYTYHDIGEVPKGVKILPAESVIPKKFVFKHLGSFATFSELFRYILLDNIGGYWSDLDVLCLKPFNFEEDMVFAWSDPEEKIIQTNVLKLPKNNIISKSISKRFKRPEKYLKYEMWFNIPVIGYLEKKLKIISNAILKKIKGEKYNLQLILKSEWGGIIGGPHALTAIVKNLNLTSKVFPYLTFNCIHHRLWWTFFYDTNYPQFFREKLEEKVYGIHFFNGVMSSYNLFNKNNPLIKGSLFEEIVTERGL